MESIRTATGKEFPCDYVTVIDLPPRMTIRISGTPLATLASVFGDPMETAQLWYENQHFDGYTALQAIIPEGNVIRVVLGKG